MTNSRRLFVAMAVLAIALISAVPALGQEMWSETKVFPSGEIVVIDYGHFGDADFSRLPTGKSATNPTPGPGGVIVDVLLLYSTNVATAHSTAAIEQLYEDSVAFANFASANSGSPHRFRLVGVIPAPGGYVDSGDLGDDQTWVKTNPEVADLRNSYGADIVGLGVRNQTAVAAGIASVAYRADDGAFFPQLAFFVFADPVITGNTIVAHELGHVVGAHHDVDAPGAGGVMAEHGHLLPPGVVSGSGGNGRTIMAISCPGSVPGSSFCPRVPYYSTPEVEYVAGVPLGEWGVSEVANWLFPLSMPIVAGFRDQVVAGECIADEDTHCLVAGGRFAVEVDWRIFNGNTGVARLVSQSDNSVVLWFFNSNNWEMMVKVLDNCGGTTNRFWVFAAATTNVEYTLRVTDTATGVERVYFNPLGVASPAITDTSAFDTCP